MKEYCLDIRGPLACFTRPEMKVERVSYDVITPSAARAIFESILWKPAIRWHIARIEVLAPIRWMNLRRNEVGGVVGLGSVKSAMNQRSGDLQLIADESRQQRASLLLRDVHYRIYGYFTMTPKAGVDDSLQKFEGMFERRAHTGQFFNQPYLGCREFACQVELIEDPSVAPVKPIEETRDLGWMVYDMFGLDNVQPSLRLYRPEMRAGVIEVPPIHSPLVKQ